MNLLSISLWWLVCLPSIIYCSNDDQCRDHPRFGSACRNVNNLKQWCERSRLLGDKVSNLAQVCRATCGYCQVDLSLKSAASPSSEPSGSSSGQQEKHQKKINETCGRPPNYSPCLPLADSNLLFKQCCQQTGILPACLHLCRYDVKVEEVQLAAFKQQCPFSILPTYFSCAAGNASNTRCCSDTGILAETGPQCIPFCDPGNGGLKSVGIRHLRCAVYLEEIMQCHWAGLR